MIKFDKRQRRKEDLTDTGWRPLEWRCGAEALRDVTRDIDRPIQKLSTGSRGAPEDVYFICLKP